MKFTLRHSDQLVGLFVLAGTIFLVGALIFVGVHKRWFKSDPEFRSHFITAEGLSTGLALEYRGFAIGRVKSLALTEDNEVEVVFSVFKEYADRIVSGSVVQLAVQPLGFGSSLVLYPGCEEGPPLSPGDLIPSTDMPRGQELLAQGKAEHPKRRDEVAGLLATVPPLVAQVQKVTGTVDQLLGRLDLRLMGPDNSPGSGLLATVDGTIHEFGGMAAQLDSTTQVLGQVLQSLAVLSSHLENPEGLVPTLLGSEGSAAQLFNDNAELYGSLTRTAAELQELMAFMNNSTPEISVLMEETTRSLAESEKVLEGLRNNPLLRGGISPEAPVRESFGGYRQEVR